MLDTLAVPPRRCKNGLGRHLRRGAEVKAPWRVVGIALALILAGDVLAWSIQTSGGVELRDIRWAGSGGHRMSALLYVPENATPSTPAPGVLAVHGYINSRETQDGFAIELARRGYVVLAMDQTGHGYSAPPAFANGFGGPDGLAYLRSLPMVDTARIGLEGHSMGGWAVQIAAASDPNGYRSMVIQGSSTGTSGAPAGTPDQPRNLSVVFSKYDEFSGMMWGSPVAAEVPATEKLMQLFGTGEPVRVGQVYGSIEEGTARIFHQPPVTHPADHFSHRAIGHTIDWFEETIGAPRPLPADSQIWFWKEFGNLVALVGMVLLLLPVGTLLLGTRFFSELAEEPAEPQGASGIRWWIAAAVFTVLPAATLFPFKDWGGVLPVGPWFPQGVTNQVVVWAVSVGLISAVLFRFWHFTDARKRGATTDDYGLTWDGGLSANKIGKSLLLAVCIAAAGYLTLAVSSRVFTVDFRFWVFAVKPMSGLHARIALGYLIPFMAFFVVYGVVLYGQLRRDMSPARWGATVVLLSTLGFVGLIAFQYLPLFAGSTLAIEGEALWSIIAFQFLPIMTIVGLVTAHFQRQTAHVWVGGFLSGILVTWIVVASQATHHGF